MISEELEKLYDLKERGILTEVEFSKEKEKIIDKFSIPLQDKENIDKSEFEKYNMYKLLTGIGRIICGFLFIYVGCEVGGSIGSDALQNGYPGGMLIISGVLITISREIKRMTLKAGIFTIIAGLINCYALSGGLSYLSIISLILGIIDCIIFNKEKGR